MDDEFGHWLAGFTDGEGCFSAYPSGNGITLSFTLHLREDDWPILAEIRRLLGFGRLTKSNGGAWLRFYRHPDLVAIVRLFDKYPLRAKKKSDFALFRELVGERTKGARADKRRVDALVAALASVKGLDEELLIPDDDGEQLPLWA
ncbi:MAG: LAGLIDADG family homing endonuclease [Thermoleophilia bacterium]